MPKVKSSGLLPYLYGFSGNKRSSTFGPKVLGLLFGLAMLSMCGGTEETSIGGGLDPVLIGGVGAVKVSKSVGSGALKSLELLKSVS